jgi:hypothetical protein
VERSKIMIVDDLLAANIRQFYVFRAHVGWRLAPKRDHALEFNHVHTRFHGLSRWLHGGFALSRRCDLLRRYDGRLFIGSNCSDIRVVGIDRSGEWRRLLVKCRCPRICLTSCITSKQVASRGRLKCNRTRVCIGSWHWRSHSSRGTLDLGRKSRHAGRRPGSACL